MYDNVAILTSFASDKLAVSVEYWRRVSLAGSQFNRGVSPLSLSWEQYGNIVEYLKNVSSQKSNSMRSRRCFLLLFRLEDIVYPHPELALFDKDFDGKKTLWRNKIGEFIQTAKSSFGIDAKCPGSLLLYLCPSSPSAAPKDFLNEMKNRIRGDLQNQYSQIHVLPKEGFSMFDLFPTIFNSRATKVSNLWYDKKSDAALHNPFTLPALVALGQVCMRILKRCELGCVTRKVIVLDCDNTLWGSSVSEVGAKNVVLSNEYKWLQSFFVRLQNMGFLLCLCSKNNENQVLEVFESRKNDMVLDLNEHIATYRINWDSKVKNMIAIADELNLHLNSFVFVDDNSGECEHVRQQCPEIAVVQIPMKPKSIRSSLLHSWAFDRPVRLGSIATDEDKVRTKRYQDSTKRQRAINHMIKESSSVEDTKKASARLYSAIISSLAVKVNFEDFVGCYTQQLIHKKMPRIRQLMNRTNQFNCSDKQDLSTKEILSYINNPEIKDKFNPAKDTLKSMALVSATDRFGHYGDVGLLMYSIENISMASVPIKSSRVLILDVFLLSCRALQRGVEYKMLQYIGAIARDKYACEIIHVPFFKTPRNGPAASFLESISHAKFNKVSGVYEIHIKNAIDCLVHCRCFKETVKSNKNDGLIQLQKHNSDALATESFVSFYDNMQMVKISQHSTLKALSDNVYENQNKKTSEITKASPFEMLMNALEAEGSNPRLRGDIRNEVKDILGEVKFVGDKKRKAATNSNVVNAELNAKQKRAKLERAKYWKRINGVASSY